MRRNRTKESGGKKDRDKDNGKRYENPDF